MKINGRGLNVDVVPGGLIVMRLLRVRKRCSTLKEAIYPFKVALVPHHIAHKRVVPFWEMGFLKPNSAAKLRWCSDLPTRGWVE